MDFIALVEKHAIAYHEKTLGQLFCDGSARAIVAMLLTECEAGGVDVRTNCAITGVTKPDQFCVDTSLGRFTSPALVLATGGLSIPKMGATGLSYDLARQFGLRVTQTRPGLVPFTAGVSSEFDVSLAGVALEAVASFEGQRFRENVLFTHRGLSGPAILQISSYWRPGRDISLDLTVDRDVAEFLIERKRSRAKSMPQTVLAEIVPARLAQVLARRLPVSEMANIPDKALTAFAARMQAWPYQPVGTEGYAKAEVTCGGIDTRDLSSKTMAAANGCGLYAIGEAVDVTGWLGGYNFQWAWSSGWSAGQAV